MHTCDGEKKVQTKITERRCISSRSKYGRINYFDLTTVLLEYFTFCITNSDDETDKNSVEISRHGYMY